MTLLGFIGPQEIILILIIGLFAFILPIIALVDILSNKFEGNNKLIWVLVVIFVNLLGAILYFAIGRQQKLPRKKKTCIKLSTGYQINSELILLEGEPDKKILY